MRCQINTCQKIAHTVKTRNSHSFDTRILFPIYGTMEEKKIVDFLNEPDFNQRFLNYNDSRKWVPTLQIYNAIEPTDSQAIQSKPTSKEANNYLLTLLVQDPSLRKLRALSEALKENKTHDNQQTLAEMIDYFLKSQGIVKLYTCKLRMKLCLIFTVFY